MVVVTAFTATAPFAMRENALKHFVLRTNSVFLREAWAVNAKLGMNEMKLASV